jgi:hypothetical protein
LRLVLQKTARFGHLEVFASIGALSFLVARFFPVLEVPFLCPFKLVTGYPCLSCGMTHAFVQLAHGELLAAIRSSPLGAAIAAFAWLLALADLVRVLARLPLPLVEPGEPLRKLALVAVPAAVAANWAWLIHCTP